MISVVIPNLHSPLIGEVIAAIERQTAHSEVGEIIVVGQDRYGRVPAHVRFIATPRPISAAAARNLGAGQATGEYILFLDADCIASSGLVEHMLARHRQGYPVVGGGVQIESDSYWTMCDNLLVFAAVLSSTTAGARADLPSLNLSIERALFARMGGFDQRFPGAAGEDIDLCLRLRASGYTLFFEPRASVAHRPGRSSAWAVWQHLRGYGRAYYTVQQRHDRLLRSPLVRMPLNAAALIMAAALPLACRDMLAFFRQNQALWRYAPLFGGMVWAKSGWYWGVAEMLFIQPE